MESSHYWRRREEEVDPENIDLRYKLTSRIKRVGLVLIQAREKKTNL
jgi:hypothetical protein